MIGWVIYNGNLQSKKIEDLVEHLIKKGKEKDLDLIAVKNNDIIIAIDTIGNPIIRHIRYDYLPDFVISWDKDINLLSHFESIGIRVYNNSKAILECDNKILMHKRLLHSGIRMPKTIIAPMVYSNSDIHDFDVYNEIINELKLPIIVKEAYGSFGMQVYKADTKEELLDIVKKLKSTEHIFQEYISESKGRDIRINIVNNEVVASMMRKSETDFRANITSGGKAFNYTPTEEEKELALKASKILNLDFSGVDILFSDTPILCEVNSNPHFKSILDCTGIDISDYILDFIKDDLC